MAPKPLVEFFQKNWGPDIPLSNDIKRKLEEDGGWEENQIEEAFLEAFAPRGEKKEEENEKNLFIKESSDWSHLTSFSENNNKFFSNDLNKKNKNKNKKKIKKVFLSFLKVFIFLIILFSIIYFSYRPVVNFLKETGYMNFLIEMAPFLFSDQYIEEIKIENDKKFQEYFTERTGLKRDEVKNNKNNSNDQFPSKDPFGLENELREKDLSDENN